MSGWVREEGVYKYQDGEYLALIDQRGEFWVNKVYHRGKLLDLGLWDGRDVAFRNANGALKKFQRYFDVDKYARDPFADEEIDDE